MPADPLEMRPLRLPDALVPRAKPQAPSGLAAASPALKPQLPEGTEARSRSSLTDVDMLHSGRCSSQKPGEHVTGAF